MIRVRATPQRICKVCGKTEAFSWVEVIGRWYLCGPCWSDTGRRLGS